MKKIIQFSYLSLASREHPDVVGLPTLDCRDIEEIASVIPSAVGKRSAVRASPEFDRHVAMALEYFSLGAEKIAVGCNFGQQWSGVVVHEIAYRLRKTGETVFVEIRL